MVFSLRSNALVVICVTQDVESVITDYDTDVGSKDGEYQAALREYNEVRTAFVPLLYYQCTACVCTAVVTVCAALPTPRPHFRITAPKRSCLPLARCLPVTVLQSYCDRTATVLRLYRMSAPQVLRQLEEYSKGHAQMLAERLAYEEAERIKEEARLEV